MRPVEIPVEMAMPSIGRGVKALHGKAIPEAAGLGRLHKGNAGDRRGSKRSKNKLHRITSVGVPMTKTPAARQKSSPEPSQIKDGSKSLPVVSFIFRGSGCRGLWARSIKGQHGTGDFTGLHGAEGFVDVAEMAALGDHVV